VLSDVDLTFSLPPDLVSVIFSVVRELRFPSFSSQSDVAPTLFLVFKEYTFPRVGPRWNHGIRGDALSLAAVFFTARILATIRSCAVGPLISTFRAKQSREASAGTDVCVLVICSPAQRFRCPPYVCDFPCMFSLRRTGAFLQIALPIPPHGCLFALNAACVAFRLVLVTAIPICFDVFATRCVMFPCFRHCTTPSPPISLLIFFLRVWR